MVVAYRADRRSGTANTKTKAEVNCSGAKPWRQKGTGRARAGYKSLARLGRRWRGLRTRSPATTPRRSRRRYEAHRSSQGAQRADQGRRCLRRSTAFAVTEAEDEELRQAAHRTITPEAKTLVDLRSVRREHLPRRPQCAADAAHDRRRGEHRASARFTRRSSSPTTPSRSSPSASHQVT